MTQVELQGVSLVVLSFFRDEAKATQLADLVQQAGGILGAAVCCAENGGDPNDDWTTCDRDRDELLDRCTAPLLPIFVFCCLAAASVADSHKGLAQTHYHALHLCTRASP